MEYKKDIINVAVVNFKVETKDKAINLKRVLGFSEAASKRGADLVLFPELCMMGYDFYADDNVSVKDKLDSAETLDGEICNAIAQITNKYDNFVVFGMAEKDSKTPDSIYNSAVAIGPTGVVGSYRKIHTFELENKWFTKGEKPFMFETPWGPISIGICYDTYQFPELMRYYVDEGSRLYLNPTAVVEEIDKNGSRQAFINYYAPTLEYGVLCNTIFIAGRRC